MEGELSPLKVLTVVLPNVTEVSKCVNFGSNNKTNLHYDLILGNNNICVKVIYKIPNDVERVVKTAENYKKAASILADDFLTIKFYCCNMRYRIEPVVMFLYFVEGDESLTVPQELYEELQDLDIIVQVINKVGNEYKNMDNVVKICKNILSAPLIAKGIKTTFANLDVSTLATLASSFATPEQGEVKNKIWIFLAGKKCIMCRTSIARINKLSTIADTKAKLFIEEFLQTVTIVDDEPCPVVTNRKETEAFITFETGKKHNVVTMSAKYKFVKKYNYISFTHHSISLFENDALRMQELHKF